MNINKKEIKNNIYLLNFDSQEDLTSTFLRFQEHYESPEFKGKIFTLDEYREWYAKKKGEFSYYTDWSGFNIPSYILNPFKQGLFDPLSDKEINLLSMFEDTSDNFYIIGIYGGTEKESYEKTLKHEIAHGLFYTNPEYRNRVKEILSKYDLEEIRSILRGTEGYHEDVLEDEAHAYHLSGSKSLNYKENEELKAELSYLFNKHLSE